MSSQSDPILDRLWEKSWDLLLLASLNRTYFQLATSRSKRIEMYGRFGLILVVVTLVVVATKNPDEVFKMVGTSAAMIIVAAFELSREVSETRENAVNAEKWFGLYCDIARLRDDLKYERGDCNYRNIELTRLEQQHQALEGQQVTSPNEKLLQRALSILAKDHGFTDWPATLRRSSK